MTQRFFYKVGSVNEIDSLRNDLNNLVSWSKEWQMLFSVDKCKVMHVGYNNCCAEYDMDGNKLETVTEEKDLGVVISDNLKWDKQCSEAVIKANKILGMIKRNFSDNSKETIIPLYKSLVRPHLEYCCQVWSPHYSKDIKLLEGVQCRATRLVSGMKSFCYADRLKNLGLMSLENRRIRSDLIETYKIINGYCNIDASIFFQFDEGGRRGH